LDEGSLFSYAESPSLQRLEALFPRRPQVNMAQGVLDPKIGNAIVEV
jgi:hypothetical protein